MFIKQNKMVIKQCNHSELGKETKKNDGNTLTKHKGCSTFIGIENQKHHYFQASRESEKNRQHSDYFITISKALFKSPK